MSADRPVVLTVTEGQALYRFMEGMQNAQYIRGYGSVCIDCGQSPENEGHTKECVVAWWLERLKDWRP